MPDWIITIHGSGPHPAPDSHKDARLIADRAVRQLRKAGHVIYEASFTSGAHSPLAGQPSLRLGHPGEPTS
jgi:hypothetical protein